MLFVIYDDAPGSRVVGESGLVPLLFLSGLLSSQVVSGKLILATKEPGKAWGMLGDYNRICRKR